MFVDRVKVFAQAGKGGGDGGRGGDVILRADRHVDNLANLFYEPIVKAKSGGHGMGKKMAGRAGAEKIVKASVGKVVWSTDESKHGTSNLQSSTPKSDQSAIDPVVDLVRDRQEFVLCRGGAGGKGNVHFKSSRNRAPRQYTEGEEGEHGYF